MLSTFLDHSFDSGTFPDIPNKVDVPSACSLDQWGSSPIIQKLCEAVIA